MPESPKLQMTVIELWSPKHLAAIVAALDEGDLVEFGQDVLVVRRRRGDDEPSGDLRVSRVRAPDRMELRLRGRGDLVCGKMA